MLYGIHPILSPELLAILAAMGHGDDIVIVDANFPAASNARKLVELAGASATDALRAIVSLMPLDTFVDDPAITMQVVGSPDEVPPIVTEFAGILGSLTLTPARPVGIERMAFYERARAAYAIVRTAERRLYGNLILKKGVVHPTAERTTHTLQQEPS